MEQNYFEQKTWKFRQCYCDLIFSVKILVLQWSCNPRFRFPKRRWLPRALSKCTLGFEGCKQKWSLRIPRACSWKRRLLRHSQRELRIRLQNQKSWKFERLFWALAPAAKVDPNLTIDLRLPHCIRRSPKTSDDEKQVGHVRARFPHE